MTSGHGDTAAADTGRVLDDLRAKVGCELGTTDWFEVTQLEADVFSALTDDWDHMHNDPGWAEGTPWGGTIAHGIYMIALIPSVMKKLTALPFVNDDPARGFTLNYGFDKVRFVAPTRIDRPVRAAVGVVSVDDRPGGSVLITFSVAFLQRHHGEEVTTTYAEYLLYMDFSSADAPTQK